MKLAIMGAGGVGGYFGGLLTASGQDVTFIARGAHLEAIRRNGLKLVGGKGETLVKPARATDDPGAVGPVDLVLFCVKLYDTESAGRALAPMIGPDSAVLTVQNGVDGPERLARIYGSQRVLGGAAYNSAVIAEPGVVRYTSAMSSLTFGELNGRESARALAFRDACRKAGFGAELTPDVAKTLWTKLVPLATNAGLTSLSRQPVGYTFQDPESRKVAVKAMREVADVARARGVGLEADAVDKALALTDGFPKDMYSSMYHDLARGRPLELEGLSGVVAKLGDELNVPTPVHRAIYAGLKPFMRGQAPA
ncbi:MAG: 2-dehydropantoate 2-reductase [Alphaproteobacteria bacterium]|nr:2-dehydropantoate 2-reductase [Alphaproteobacteria bacterium]